MQWDLQIETAKQHLGKDALFKSVMDVVSLDIQQPTGQPFVSLVRSIVSQQLSTRAANTIYGRLLESFPEGLTATDILGRSEEALRSVGLSRQKVGYLQNLASHVEQNHRFWMDIERKDNQQITTELIQIKGIGQWTIDMFLIFNLGRLDVLPLGDLAIRDALSRLHQLDGSKKQQTVKMREVTKGWKPYRSIACRYLWKWRDQGWT